MTLAGWLQQFFKKDTCILPRKRHIGDFHSLSRNSVQIAKYREAYVIVVVPFL